MKNDFSCSDWKKYIPRPVYRGKFEELYEVTWQLAHDHIKYIDGMPQSPYMDEAFCDTNIWIWDTCFMSLFCKFAPQAFPGVQSLNNFYEALYGGGIHAKIIPSNNEPSWTGATPGEPSEIWVHIADNPPLFAWAEYENALIAADEEHLKNLLYERKVLQKHYAWIEGLKKEERIKGVLCETCLIAEPLGYKWEGGRSGMDNTPRGREGAHAEKERPNNPNMLWLDAICQQSLSASMLAKTFKLLGDGENAAVWQAAADKKNKIINDYYWDSADNFYYDIDCRDHSFFRVKTPASFWALTAGAATPERAKKMAEYVLDPNVFGGNVPLCSLANNDADFSPRGKYWRGALWLPTAYAALKGLVNYGFFSEARQCAIKIIEHMRKTYEQYSPHTVWECYSPAQPAPATGTTDDFIVRKDFCGWSALGPIAMYIEFVIGFYEINAFTGTVKWALDLSSEGEVGVKNLRFGNVIADITACGKKCSVRTNEPFTLQINGKAYRVRAGENAFDI